MQANLANIVNFLRLFLSLFKITSTCVQSTLFIPNNSLQKQVCYFHTDQKIRQICETHHFSVHVTGQSASSFHYLVQRILIKTKICKKFKVIAVFLLLYKMYTNTEKYTSLKVVQSNVAIQTCFLNTHTEGI